MIWLWQTTQFTSITSLYDDTSDRLSFAKLISNDDNIEVRKYLVIPDTECLLIQWPLLFPLSPAPMELSTTDFSLCANIFNKYNTHWLGYGWVRNFMFALLSNVNMNLYEYIQWHHEIIAKRVYVHYVDDEIHIEQSHPNGRIESCIQVFIVMWNVLHCYQFTSKLPAATCVCVCVLTYLIWSVENHLNLFQQVRRSGHTTVLCWCVWVSELLASFWLINSHTRFVVHLE